MLSAISSPRPQPLWPNSSAVVMPCPCLSFISTCAGMPRPVSRTTKIIASFDALYSPLIATVPPFGVYLRALLTRFDNTCSSSSGSVRNAG